MTLKLQEYIALLNQSPPVPSFEPVIDDLDEKQDRKLRELEDLSSGAIQTGQLEPGDGGPSPREGFLVYIQLSIKSPSGDKVLDTTRADEGGSGVPLLFVIGKGKRAPRGWELAVEDMTRGQRVAVKLKPEYGFGQKDCSFKPPKGHSVDEDFLYDMQLVNFYPPAGIKIDDASGTIIRRTLTESNSWESPRAPFEVMVACKARVPSSSGRQGEGTPFFSTPADKPLHFTIGDKAAPEGLQSAVCLLSKGEKAIVSCPASQLRSQADGEIDLKIPSKVERVELELHLQRLIEVRDLTGTKEVTKRRVKEGVGEFPADCPIEDCAVRIHYKAWLPEKAEEILHNTRGESGAEPPLEFETGMGAVPEALDMAVRLMTPEEVALVTSSSQYAYKGRSDRPPGAPEDAQVCFEVELVGFDKQPNWSQASAAVKLERGLALKTQGNAAFKAGLNSQAQTKWQKALKVLNRVFDIESDEQEREIAECRCSCMVNMATSMHRQGDYTQAFTWCDRALKEQPDHSKALYRRAMTHAELHDYESARDDLQAAKGADPSNAADIDRELAKLKVKEKAGMARQRKEMSNFFRKP